ncbi:MetS family NSS transporter small subunit [Gordonia sp. VNK21]|uniref:MetS family NSS transporter small subunit n=1 Tax=Gordonia sp. VNK21 TaxID=3382483 RepID=UPI0038D46E02
MTGPAIALLVVAVVLVWGGLIAAVVFLNLRPEVTDLPDETDAQIADDAARESEPHPMRDT